MNPQFDTFSYKKKQFLVNGNGVGKAACAYEWNTDGPTVGFDKLSPVAENAKQFPAV